MNVATIKAVMNTMNDIEVKGIENMSKFLGCYEALESLARAEELAQMQEETNG